MYHIQIELDSNSLTDDHAVLYWELTDTCAYELVPKMKNYFHYVVTECNPDWILRNDHSLMCYEH